MSNDVIKKILKEEIENYFNACGLLRTLEVFKKEYQTELDDLDEDLFHCKKNKKSNFAKRYLDNISEISKTRLKVSCAQKKLHVSIKKLDQMKIRLSKIAEACTKHISFNLELVNALETKVQNGNLTEIPESNDLAIKKKLENNHLQKIENVDVRGNVRLNKNKFICDNPEHCRLSENSGCQDDCDKSNIASFQLISKKDLSNCYPLLSLISLPSNTSKRQNLLPHSYKQSNYIADKYARSTRGNTSGNLVIEFQRPCTQNNSASSLQLIPDEELKNCDPLLPLISRSSNTFKHKNYLSENFSDSSDKHSRYDSVYANIPQKIDAAFDNVTRFDSVQSLATSTLCFSDNLSSSNSFLCVNRQKKKSAEVQNDPEARLREWCVNFLKSSDDIERSYSNHTIKTDFAFCETSADCNISFTSIPFESGNIGSDDSDATRYEDGSIKKIACFLEEPWCISKKQKESNYLLNNRTENECLSCPIDDNLVLYKKRINLSQKMKLEEHDSKREKLSLKSVLRQYPKSKNDKKDEKNYILDTYHLNVNKEILNQRSCSAILYSKTPLLENKKETDVSKSRISNNNQKPALSEDLISTFSFRSKSQLNIFLEKSDHVHGIKNKMPYTCNSSDYKLENVRKEAQTVQNDGWCDKSKIFGASEVIGQSHSVRNSHLFLNKGFKETGEKVTNMVQTNKELLRFELPNDFGLVDFQPLQSSTLIDVRSSESENPSKKISESLKFKSPDWNFGVGKNKVHGTNSKREKSRLRQYFNGTDSLDGNSPCFHNTSNSSNFAKKNERHTLLGKNKRYSNADLNFRDHKNCMDFNNLLSKCNDPKLDMSSANIIETEENTFPITNAFERMNANKLRNRKDNDIFSNIERDKGFQNVLKREVRRLRIRRKEAHCSDVL